MFMYCSESHASATKFVTENGTILCDSNSDKRFVAFTSCELQKNFFERKKDITMELKILRNSISNIAEK